MVDKVNRGSLAASRTEQLDQAAQNAAGRAGTNTYLVLPFSQTGSTLMRGILWAEVLGRPLCKRKGRGRYGL